MRRYTTRETAKAIGVSWITLQRWVSSGKVKAPPVVLSGNRAVRLWSESAVKKLRKQLPTLFYKHRTRRSRKAKR